MHGQCLESVDVDTESEETEQVPTATVEVKNPTGATANYEITVEFKWKRTAAETFEAGDGAGRAPGRAEQDRDSAVHRQRRGRGHLHGHGGAERRRASGPRSDQWSSPGAEPAARDVSLEVSPGPEHMRQCSSMHLRIAARPHSRTGDGVRQCGMGCAVGHDVPANRQRVLEGWLLVCVRLPDGCDLKVVLSARRNCGPEGPRGGDRPPLSSASIIG